MVKFLSRVRTLHLVHLDRCLIPLLSVRCGVFVLQAEGNEVYTDQAYHNDIALGAKIRDLKNTQDIQSIFPPGVKTASFEGRTGYLNLEGGWAYASQSMLLLMIKVANIGAKIHPARAVTELVKENGRTKGVRCADGSEYEADLVVLASGSWTPSTFSSLPLYDKCLATG